MEYALALAALLVATQADARCLLASRYDEGTFTANGERFRPRGHTAAHRTLPFGTRLHVTNPKTGWSVTVRINDRGPARWTGRELDLSTGAADAIGLTARQGVGRVCI